MGKPLTGIGDLLRLRQVLEEDNIDPDCVTVNLKESHWRAFLNEQNLVARNTGTWPAAVIAGFGVNWV